MITPKDTNVTYEHCVVQRFHNDIWIGDAERNYYIDKNHEICLCAHYNTRVKGTYKFIPDYHFYITKKRMSLDLHWHLGNISDASQIIEEFDSLDDAEKSQFYNDFCELKDFIDSKIREQKLREKAIDFGSYRINYTIIRNKKGKVTGHFYEIPVDTTKEFACIMIDYDKDEWTLSVSSEPVMDMFRYFEDFLELDRKELHLLHTIPLINKDLSKESPYYMALEYVKEDLGLTGGIFVEQIDVDEIAYMQYIETSFSVERMIDGLPPDVWKREVFYYPEGRVMVHQMLEDGEERDIKTEKNYPPETIRQMYIDIATYLSNKRFKQNIFYDDASGTLFVYYNDGHKEKYDRGLSVGDDSLIYHILKVD